MKLNKLIEIYRSQKIFLILSLIIAGLLVIQTQAIADNPKNAPAYTSTPSPLYTTYINAPNITQAQKDLAIMSVSSSDLYKKYMNYPHSDWYITWNYPYDGNTIFLSTVINPNSPNATIFGLLSFDVNLKNKNITYSEFSNWKSDDTILTQAGSSQSLTVTTTSSTVTPAVMSYTGIASCAFNYVYSKEGQDTNATAAIWNNKGLYSITVIDPAMTKANMLNYWQNDYYLGYYNNVGPDCTQNGGSPCFGIEDHNGANIDYSTIQNTNLPGLYNCRIFINGCNSFKNPLYNAIMAKSPRFYVGALVLIPAQWSEDVSVDFWSNYCNLHQTVPNALNNSLIKNHRPTAEYTWVGSQV